MTNNSTLRTGSQYGHLCRFDKTNQDELRAQFAADSETLNHVKDFVQLDEESFTHAGSGAREDELNPHSQSLC